jgi:hypothetical protein
VGAYLAWLDSIEPKASLNQNLCSLVSPYLMWQAPPDKFHEACKFQIMGCSQKIALFKQ